LLITLLKLISRGESGPAKEKNEGATKGLKQVPADTEWWSVILKTKNNKEFRIVRIFEGFAVFYQAYHRDRTSYNYKGSATTQTKELLLWPKLQGT